MPPALCLYLAACQYPAGILERSRLVHPKVDAPSNVTGPADLAIRRLALERQSDIARHGAPSRLILAGDLIYADATAGLFDPVTRDQPWRRAWDMRSQNPWVRKLNGPGSIISVLDDHEIEDNWEPSNNDKQNAALREAMYRGRLEFIKSSSRGSFARPGASTDARLLWYPDKLDGKHFLFIGDTRTERQARDPAELMRARLMRSEQMRTLLTGLDDAPEDTHKVIVTSSMLLPRPLGLADAASPEAAVRCDSWCGYPASLHQVLAHIADNAIEHCLFLSGDEHLPCLAEITVQCTNPGGPEVKLTSIHAGALYAPYPFANARPAMFLERDSFRFSVTRQNDQNEVTRDYLCTVRATFPPVRHEGYVKIELSDKPSIQPAVTVTFRDALDPARDQTY